MARAGVPVMPVPATASGWLTDRQQRCGLSSVALVLALAALAVVPRVAHAQDRNADAELEALIPDAAVDNPEDWARATPGTGPADGATPDGAPRDEPPPDGPPLDPESPLAEGAGFTLPWPDDSFQLPALVSLEPDPGIAQALAQEVPALPGRNQPRQQGEVSRLSSRLSLVFPADPAAFPEREAFEDRFRALSTIETLAADDADSIAQLAVRARTDADLLRKLLRIYGYYEAEVYQVVAGRQEGDIAGDAAATPAADDAETGNGTAPARRTDRRPSVRFEIVPGARYRFGTIELGDLKDAGPDYPRLREAFGLKPGDFLSTDSIVAERADLDTALGESGYAFAKVGEPDLLVDHAREEGDLTVPVAPGGRYAITTITSELPRFLSGRHLQRIARFEPGDLYRRSDVEDLRRAIVATGLVSSVAVTPRETAPPQGAELGSLSLDVTMTKAPLRTIAGQLGYDTLDGFRLAASWEHRNLFPPEGMLRLRGIAGTREQLAGVTFRRNNFRARDQVLTFDLYANTVKRQAYAARTLAFAATFEKLTTLIFQKPWTWSVGLETVATNEREGDVGGVRSARQTYYIAAVPLRAAYDGSDDLLDPTRGFRAALRVSPEMSWEQGGPNSKYLRVQADASAYLPVAGKVVLATRGRVGSIPGTDIANIAPSRRFYAGGGGSVRGYGYQQIGPRNSLGDPSGGRSLTEFSLEARVRTGLFGGALSVVPFVDAGAVDAGPTPRLRDIRYGAGIGVRYHTGFGPIRVDIGTPLNPRPGDGRIALYVSLGQAF